MPYCIDCGRYAGEELWRKYCRACFAYRKKEEHDSAVQRVRELEEELLRQIIPVSRLREMLMLCHPDKHNNSELSNNLTKWVLAYKKRHWGVE